MSPTNEERNGESSSYRHRDKASLSGDDQNHPPIRADQILRSHRSQHKAYLQSLKRRCFVSNGILPEVTNAGAALCRASRIF